MHTRLEVRSRGTARIPHVSLLVARALFVLSAVGPAAWAGDGDLDPTLGGRGAVITDFSDNDDYVGGLAIQPDGKIVVAGQSGVYPLFHPALARYDVDGALDPTFGNGGKVVANFDAGGEQINAVAIQPDGKIVGAGALLHDNLQTAFFVARFHEDGCIDQAFGDLGVTITTFGDGSAAASAVLLQPDGGIVVVGFSGAGPYSELNDYALARYNYDGSLDQSFGQGGKVITHFSGVYNTGSIATSAALQADGMLLVAGRYKNEGTPRTFALARYRSDGSLDATFGSNGKTTTSLGSADAFAMGIVLQLDAKIVLAGAFQSGHKNHDFALVRYDANGDIDTTFGSGGQVISDFSGGSDDIAYDLALQRDGKLILAGRTGEYPNFEFGLARYDTNGTLDPSFGDAGKVSTSFGGFSTQAYASALQWDGKIVLAGYMINTNIDFVVARYLATVGPRYVKH